MERPCGSCSKICGIDLLKRKGKAGLWDQIVYVSGSLTDWTEWKRANVDHEILREDVREKHIQDTTSQETRFFARFSSLDSTDLEYTRLMSFQEEGVGRSVSAVL